MALKTSTTYYISWSTISTTVFVVEIDQDFAKRLLKYLTIFAQSAVAGQRLQEFDIEHQGESVDLLLKTQELAKGCHAQFTFGSIIEESALKNIKPIVEAVDSFHKEKENKKAPVIQSEIDVHI